LRLTGIVLLLIGIAVRVSDPVAVLIVGALSAGLRSGSLSVRIAGIIAVARAIGVAGVIVVARTVGVSIGSAEAEVNTSSVISAIAGPHIIAGRDIAAAVVTRAASTIHARAHIARSPAVMASAGIAMAVASPVTAAIPSQASGWHR